MIYIREFSIYILFKVPIEHEQKNPEEKTIICIQIFYLPQNEMECK